MSVTQIVFDVNSYERDQREVDRRPLTEKQDPLALSWASYRVWEKFPERRWVSWNDIEAHDHDKEMADSTRRYYRDKLAMQALKNSNGPTKFARDLYDICNGGIMRECHRGMIYRLPYFFVEDVRDTELRTIFPNSLITEATFNTRQLAEKNTQHLVPVMKIFRSRKQSEIMEYWFRDSYDNPVCWAVKYDNPLRSLTDGLFEQPSIDLSGFYHKTHKRDFVYQQISRPEVKFGQ